MMDNFVPWVTHVAVLIAAGILSARWLNWRHPQSRLRFLQILLTLSFLLPLLEPRRAQPPALALSSSVVTVSSAPVARVPALAVGWRGPLEAALLALLAGGILVRGAQLTIGLAKLGWLRRRGRAIVVAGVINVEVREVEGLNGPAAFGWLHPVILLPAGLVPGPTRDAAIRHELQHILRRDWLENLIERIAGALLWFHPMVWWLLEHIHLSREQAVDLEVAGAGPDRDQYLQSLLASAGLANTPALPVTSFIRRPRHLVERVALLAKETPMSIRRTALTAALAALLSGAALTLASFYLPMRLSAQEAAGVPESPYNWVRPSPKTEGAVVVEVTVSAEGEFLDARVVSGRDELRKPALQSVLYWRDPQPTGARRVVTITIEFKKLNSFLRQPPPPSPPPPAVENARFEGVDYVGLSNDVQPRAAALMATLQTGQRVTEAQLDRLAQDLKSIDSALRLSRSMQQVSSGITLRLSVGNESPRPQDLAPLAFGLYSRLGLSVGNESPRPPLPIRIGPAVQEANLVQKVEPVYPPLALEARIQGIVKFEITVSGEGTIQNMKLVSGHPLLVQPAQQALMQYRYKPTLLNGQPTAVLTTVDIEFRL